MSVCGSRNLAYLLRLEAGQSLLLGVGIANLRRKNLEDVRDAIKGE